MDDVRDEFAGFTTTAITTDPDSNLYLMIESVKSTQGRPPDAPPKQLVAVIPHKFHGTRDGFILLSYDPLIDPRSEYYKQRATGSR